MVAFSFSCKRGGELSGTCLPVVRFGAELLDRRSELLVVVEGTSEEPLRALQLPSAPLGCATERGVPGTHVCDRPPSPTSAPGLALSEALASTRNPQPRCRVPHHRRAAHLGPCVSPPRTPQYPDGTKSRAHLTVILCEFRYRIWRASPWRSRRGDPDRCVVVAVTHGESSRHQSVACDLDRATPDAPRSPQSNPPS